MYQHSLFCQQTDESAFIFLAKSLPSRITVREEVEQGACEQAAELLRVRLSVKNQYS